MKQKKVILLLFMFLLAGAGCASNTANEGEENSGYTNVESEQDVQQLIEEGVQVIDVRTPEEFAEGHIPSAKLIPLDELESRLDEFEEGKKYVIVCRSGNRSTQASEALTANGIKGIYNYTGGMNAWQGEIEK